MSKIGIRKEDKNIWERRVPLTPNQVRHLTDAGLQVVVEPSEQRAFSDGDYRDAGALISGDLDSCPVVFAVKEIPEKMFQPNHTYVFFSHTIKGQKYNMPMLQKLIDLKCTLIDYEKVVDEKNRRLIFFGRHAGLAGMIDSLWALGQRLKWEGLTTPFETIEPAHRYPDLEAAMQAVRLTGQRIQADGLPEVLRPMAFGFAGYGNVSLGAQEIFDLVPHQSLEPDALFDLKPGDGSQVFKVVFKEEHMAVPRDPEHAFELQDYYQHPEKYRGVFARYVPRLTGLINCIYWTPDYPRLVSRDLLHGLFGEGQTPHLRIIGDISCDVEGAVECTLKSTDSGDPVFVYRPDVDRAEMGVAGHGPVVLAVDNLPCELPVESSRDFGQALQPFTEEIAKADYSVGFDQLRLPAPIRRAVIVHQGQLTPDYSYLQESLDRA